MRVWLSHDATHGLRVPLNVAAAVSLRHLQLNDMAPTAQNYSKGAPRELATFMATNPAIPFPYKWVMSTSQIIIETLQYFCLYAGVGILGFFVGRYKEHRWPKRSK